MTTPVIPKAHNLIRQQNPIPNLLPRISWTDQLAVSGTAATYTVPANVTMIRLSPLSAAGACFGNLNGVAVVPAGGITNGSGSFAIQSGMMMNVNPGDSLSIIGASASFVAIDAFT